jgi:hypothetical protein
MGADDGWLEDPPHAIDYNGLLLSEEEEFRFTHKMAREGTIKGPLFSDCASVGAPDHFLSYD